MNGKYYRLTEQPFSLRFLFRAFSSELTDGEQVMSEPGELHIHIKVNNVLYGPYQTGIKATSSAFAFRHHPRASHESKELKKEIQHFIGYIERAHTHLEPRMNPMDGPSLMKVAKLLSELRVN